MAREGWQVAASARRSDKLAELERAAADIPGSIHPVPLDVTDAPATTTAIAEIEKSLGPIDQAVLNAGTHKPVRATALDIEDFRSLVDLNLMGTVNCLAPLLQRMTARGNGRIAMVASLAGYRGLPTSGAYGMTKAGLINLAEALRPELDGHGVTLQIVNPGFVRTPLTDRNDFPMPFLMEADDAAAALYQGLHSNRFEIAFPRRFAYMMSVLRILPAPIAFALTRRLVPQG